jgi:hypothetical protein
VATRCKASVCGHLAAGIAGSNPVKDMGVCLLCLYVVLSCVGKGLCDELITHPEESYGASNCVCVITKPQYRGGQGSNKGCSAVGKIPLLFHNRLHF